MNLRIIEKQRIWLAFDSFIYRGTRLRAVSRFLENCGINASVGA